MGGRVRVHNSVPLGSVFPRPRQASGAGGVPRAPRGESPRRTFHAEVGGGLWDREPPARTLTVGQTVTISLGVPPFFLSLLEVNTHCFGQ